MERYIKKRHALNESINPELVEDVVMSRYNELRDSVARVSRYVEKLEPVMNEVKNCVNDAINTINSNRYDIVFEEDDYSVETYEVNMFKSNIVLVGKGGVISGPMENMDDDAYAQACDAMANILKTLTRIGFKRKYTDTYYKSVFVGNYEVFVEIKFNNETVTIEMYLESNDKVLSNARNIFNYLHD